MTLFSWKISGEELKYQIDNYHTLPMSKSYRGVVVIVMTILLGLTAVLSLFNIFVSTSEMIASLIIYIPILVLVYKGHRWATITLFILWTAEKVGTVFLSIQNNLSPISSIIWWFALTPFIFIAIKIETERRKAPSANVASPNVLP